MASIKARVGYYDVIETLGSGSFGKVKLAYHIITGHKVALKFINKEKVSNEPGMHLRIAREVEYLRFLRHPHIIKLYEVLHTPTDLVMVMEYAGDELFQYISERGRMAEHEALRFLQQLVSAVEYCHRHCIVHRDLKPENLLLDNSKNLKVADFGLSNCLKDGDFLKTSCGSPNYAAPEVILGKLYAGPEVDVWSIGVILFVMLVGRLPFEDEYIPSLFHKISTAQYTIPSFISAGARSILSAMLVVDPIKRISITQLRTHVFFNQNLPAYLTPFPTVPQSLFSSEEAMDPDDVPLDDSIVTLLVDKLKLTPDEVVSRLVSQASSPSSPTASSTSTDPVRVAYMLCLDNKHLWNNTTRSDDAFRDTRWVVSSTPPVSSVTTYNPISPRMSVASSSLATNNSYLSLNDTHVLHNPATYLPLLMDVLEHTSISIFQRPELHQVVPLPPPTKKSRVKWHVGIRSRSNPFDVMLELYKAVLAVGMECKPRGPFALRARYARPTAVVDKPATSPSLDLLLLDSNPITPPYPEHSELVVKLDLQLYKVDTDYYLVDFKLVLPTSNPQPSFSHSSSDLSFGLFPPSPITSKFDTSMTSKTAPLASIPELSKPPLLVSPSPPSSAPGTGGVASFRRRSSSLSARSASFGGTSGVSDRIVSPYAFLDCAVRIIAELASSG